MLLRGWEAARRRWAKRPVKITRTSEDRVRLRRAGIVLASVQGRPASVIAQMFAASEGYVREVIHAFTTPGSWPSEPDKTINEKRAIKKSPRRRHTECPHDNAPLS